MEFKNLHKQNKPLLMSNVWDVPSTELAEKLNFQAIGTSSSAIASIIGYNDGEEMEFSELEYFVAKIIAISKLPLSVDLESGYSRNPMEIAENIKRLANLGIAGINLEDSIIVKERTLLNVNEFAQTLSRVRELLEKDPNNLDVIWEMGKLSMQSTQYDKAVMRFEKFVSLTEGEDKVSGLIYLSDAYFFDKKRQQAKEALLEAKKLNKNSELEIDIQERINIINLN